MGSPKGSGRVRESDARAADCVPEKLREVYEPDASVEQMIHETRTYVSDIRCMVGRITEQMFGTGGAEEGECKESGLNGLHRDVYELRGAAMKARRDLGSLCDQLGVETPGETKQMGT